MPSLESIYLLPHLPFLLENLGSQLSLTSSLLFPCQGLCCAFRIYSLVHGFMSPNP